MDRDAPGFILDNDKRQHDGDTLHGFVEHEVTLHIQGIPTAEVRGKAWLPHAIRVLHVDTPEVVGRTKTAGMAAREATLTWLAQHSKLYLVTDWENDKYGRLLAEVWAMGDEGGDLLDDPVSLHDHLLTNGFAKAYEGGAR
jgi:endonuclease YncB( thermonuclease family)